MLLQSFVGYFVAFCTSISFLPQVLLIIKTKNTSAISLPMYLIYVSGVILWLTYGFLIHDKVVVIANIFTLFLASIVLFLNLKTIFLN